MGQQVAMCWLGTSAQESDPGFKAGFPLSDGDQARYLLPLIVHFLICRLGTVVVICGVAPRMR